MLIKGQKINLRQLKRKDAEDISKHLNNREVSRYTARIPYPYKLEYAQEFIKKSLRQKKDQIVWGIEDPLTKKIIGIIDLTSINYHDSKGAILGYWLGKKYWGQGIMTEVVKLVLNYAFQKLKLVRVQATVMHTNKPSMRVLEKCDFKQEGILRKKVYKNKKWLDIFIYGILKEEFKK
jgi:[ribosomal protein S5]-alanine N-acetyltransferase